MDRALPAFQPTSGALFYALSSGALGSGKVLRGGPSSGTTIVGSIALCIPECFKSSIGNGIQVKNAELDEKRRE